MLALTLILIFHSGWEKQESVILIKNYFLPSLASFCEDDGGDDDDDREDDDVNGEDYDNN